MEEYPTAGCVPFRYTLQGEIEILMVLNDAEENGHWEFPKGKHEVGEDSKETALRELEEETGLTGKLLEEEPIEFEFDCHMFGNHYHKTVQYFYCRVPDNAEVHIQEDELMAYAWLPLNEIEERATYPKMKEAAHKVCEYFKDCGTQ